MQRSPLAWPANLVYLPNFYVVEELQGTTHLIPHTDQLPQIARALRLEFCDGLPRRISDDPVCRAAAAIDFSRYIREIKRSPVWPYPVLTKTDSVSVAVVQRISKETPGGRLHSFRLFQEGGFLPDICFNGSPVEVCTHFFDRFYHRSVDGERSDAIALNILLRAPKLLVVLSDGTRAIALDGRPTSIIPYDIIGGTLVLKTCLTKAVCPHFKPMQPVTLVYANFGTTYCPPPNSANIGRTLINQLMNNLEDDTRLMLQLDLTVDSRTNWATRVGRVPRDLAECGLSADSRVGFMNDIYGPTHFFNFDPAASRGYYMGY